MARSGVGAAGAYYVLTWIGIIVMFAVLVYWVIWENRRLDGFATAVEEDVMDDDRKRQVEFPELQTHSKKFEAVMVGLSILCVIIVLVDRAVYQPGDRIQADGLEGFADNRTKAPAKVGWRGVVAILALVAA